MTSKPSAKDRILDAALALFNERGSANVTTNHIGQAIGMSPGTLYYHYRHKEAIIQALFERLDTAWDTDYALPAGDRLGLTEVIRLLHVTFETMWHYRFFYRETLSLLHNDPALAARYREVRARGLAGTEQLLGQLIDSAVLVPATRWAAPSLAVLMRIVTDNWLNFKALGEEAVDPADMHEGVRTVLALVEPYLTAQSQDSYRRYALAQLEQDSYRQRLQESRHSQEEPV